MSSLEINLQRANFLIKSREWTILKRFFFQKTVICNLIIQYPVLKLSGWNGYSEKSPVSHGGLWSGTHCPECHYFLRCVLRLEGLPENSSASSLVVGHVEEERFSGVRIHCVAGTHGNWLPVRLRPTWWNAYCILGQAFPWSLPWLAVLFNLEGNRYEIFKGSLWMSAFY